MAYPLIIFGAGASYDYSPLRKIAPLTNHLTNNEFLAHDLLEQYKGAGGLLSDIIYQVWNKNKNFEYRIIFNASLQREQVRLFEELEKK
jgi:hypothetical protein